MSGSSTGDGRSRHGNLSLGTDSNVVRQMLTQKPRCGRFAAVDTEDVQRLGGANVRKGENPPPAPLLLAHTISIRE